MWIQPLLLVLWFACFQESLGALVNRTIDDTLGDSVTGKLPVYLPQYGLWNTGQNCSGCAAQLDANLTFDKTWHDVEYNQGLNVTTAPSMTLAFNGTAIYVFCILANTNSPGSQIGFTLDGLSAGNYTHVPLPNTPYAYNQSVFQQEGLGQTEHTLVATLLKDTIDSQKNTLLLFDYAVYTVDEDVTSPSTPSAPATNVSTSHKSTPAGAIAGGVVGGVVVLALLFGLLLFLRRRSEARRAQLLPHPLAVATDTPSPFITEKPDKLAFRAEGSIDPYPVSLPEHSSPAPPNSRSAMSSSGSSRGGEIPAGTTATQSTSEKSPLPPSDASTSLSASSPVTLGTEPTPTTAATGEASSSTLTSAASMQPTAAATTEPETQRQLQSLWQEVRMLRAQQEMQLTQAETPPEYEEDE